MLRIIFNTGLFVSLFFTLQVGATSLSERVIQSGSYSGQKLIDIVEAYTIPGESRSSRVHIPSKAIHDAFNFFDTYAGTTRRYTSIGIYPVVGRPGFQYLGGSVTATGPTIANQRLMAIFDLNLHSSLKRLHVIDLETGEINSFEAAHGKDSECSNRPGYACNFVSNRDSFASPLGFFVANQVINSEEHGRVVTMVGLEKSSNGFSGNDVPTTVVIHPAAYVTAGHAGHSHGCPAVSESNIGWIRDNLKDGALFYFYHTSLDSREPAVGGLETQTTVAPPASVEDTTPPPLPDEEI